MKFRFIYLYFLFAYCLLPCCQGFMPSIKTSLVPCAGESPWSEARLGKLLIAFYRMDKAVMAQTLIRSAHLKVLGRSWVSPGQA